MRCAKNTPPRLHTHTSCSYAVVQLNKDVATSATVLKNQIVHVENSSLMRFIWALESSKFDSHVGPLFSPKLREFRFFAFPFRVSEVNRSADVQRNNVHSKLRQKERSKWS